MTDEVSNDTGEIEGLLADRQRLHDWLAKLDDAKAPAAVRSRVRADYEGRLAEVVVRLRGFSEALTGSLAELRSRLCDVHGVKSEAEEERAEASLRHMVGEYTDTEWQEYEEASTTQLSSFAGDIGQLSSEIQRLEEVLEQVSPEPAEVMAGQASEAAERLEVEVIEPEEVTLESRMGHEEEESAADGPYDQSIDLTGDRRVSPKARPVEAPRFVPKASEAIRRERPTRTLRFPPAGSAPAAPAPNVDEMTFIKSVALESPEAPSGRSRSANAKTLKCADCGSMNRPTEWYCEKCGAELAAL